MTIPSVFNVSAHFFHDHQLLFRERQLRRFFLLTVDCTPYQHNIGDVVPVDGFIDEPYDDTECDLWLPYVGTVLEEVNGSLSMTMGASKAIDKHRHLVKGCGQCEHDSESWYDHACLTYTSWGSRHPDAWTDFVKSLG